MLPSQGQPSPYQEYNYTSSNYLEEKKDHRHILEPQVSIPKPCSDGLKLSYSSEDFLFNLEVFHLELLITMQMFLSKAVIVNNS